MALTLTGGTVISMKDGCVEAINSDIRVEHGQISAIGNLVAQPGDEIVQCSDTLIMPGFVNVHTHAGTGVFRGAVEDVPAGWWSGNYLIPGQERLSPEDYGTAARISAGEYLLNGVTCIADRYSFMDHIAPALERSGIRAIVGQSVSDNRGRANWSASDEIVERFGVKPEIGRVSASIAPHALDSCSDELLKECTSRAEALGCRVFAHVAQSRIEVESLRGRGYSGALECLMQTGLANPNLVAAHCIFLTDDEIDAWPKFGMAIAHCPASNLKIEARTVPIARLIGKVPVGLGTDWTASDNAMDIIAEARLAALAGKLVAADPTTLKVEEMLGMMTIGGAKALGLDHIVGSIEVGKRADLIVFDLSRLEANPRSNLAANVLYSMSPRSVRDVYVEGEVLVKNAKLVREDENELVSHANRLGATIR